ncbi:unnamed protein product [Dovyalis caffra]|uniref:3'-5' exonuclease domain-containing protein n=1 Tax=Dovyalis caffra TaxID=77055 RepID=A0AAV1SAR6_9ROSI|nr:unnamed protein product [Dovyalis caffra]
MEITVELINKSIRDPDYRYDGYTVQVENHRILTVVSGWDHFVSKWIKQVSKTNNSASSSSSNSLIVGVSADKQYVSGRKGSENYNPYNLLQLCVGSHCLLYHLPNPYDYCTCKALRNFFSNPKVIAVGVNIKHIAKQLEEEHEIKFKNVIDVSELAMKEVGKEFVNLNLSKFDLDKLAKALLGKHKDVVRPEEKVEWFTKTPYCYMYEDPEMTDEKVKLATVDAYLCFLMGWELFYNVDDCKLNVARALKDRMKKESKYPKKIQRKQKTKILKRSMMMDYTVDDTYY